MAIKINISYAHKNWKTSRQPNEYQFKKTRQQLKKDVCRRHYLSFQFPLTLGICEKHRLQKIISKDLGVGKKANVNA